MIAFASAPARIVVSVTLALALMPFAQAQSRRDRAASEALTQSLTAAETRYRQASEQGGETQPIVAEIEAIIARCADAKGCEVAPLLQRYRQLLQASSEAAEAVASGEDPIDFTADDVPPEAVADALLDETNRRFAQAVQFNPAVQSGIRRWLTDMRPSLMQSYENYQYMRHLMAPAFQRQRLPEALLFGILAKESNGKVHVGSRAGAVGPLQFMPATGRRFGLGPDGSGFDTRYDPRAAAEAAAAYLQERYAQLNSNIEMSLAAYNGGEGRALRVYQSSGGRNFWEYDVFNQFPAETKDYVPMVVAAAWLFLHPEDYGLRFPRVASRPALLRLQQPTTLYELTICLGNTSGSDGFLRALRNLNPRFEPQTRLLPGTTLNATTQIARLYNRHCLDGKRLQLARQLVTSDPSLAIVRVGSMTSVQSLAADGTPQPASKTVYVPGEGAVEAKVATGVPAKPAPPRRHRVTNGETLTAVARKYDCSVRDLADANDIPAPRYAIRPGQVLKLDGCKL